jgi:polycomb protein EED
MSYDYRMLATGNQAGQIYLWNLQDIPHHIDDYIEKKKVEYSETKKEKVVKKKRGNIANKKINDLADSALSNGSSECADNKKPTILDSNSCESTIRQVGFSNDRQWIVAVCDNNSIWCWKNVENNASGGNA